MKKFSVFTFAISMIVSSYYTSSANATESKTQGHYVGVDIIQTKARFNERYSANYSPEQSNFPSNYSNKGVGAGLNYKYAFNFNGIFIAPGIFFEQNNTTTRGTDENYLSRIDIKNRYGLKTDLGYDVTNKISPYVTGGYTKVSYRTRNFITSGGNTTTTIENSTTGDWFYGAGLKLNYNDNISFNIEYNRQDFAAKTKVTPISQYNSIFKTRLDILKAGISYNF